MTWEWIKDYEGGPAIFVHLEVCYDPFESQNTMFLAEAHWRRYVGYWNCDIHYNSVSNHLYPTEKYNEALLKHASSVGIKHNSGSKLVEVRPSTREAVFENTTTNEQVVQKYKLLHVTPPCEPHPFIKASPLADADGWVDVNKTTLQHNRYPNVFALGDCINLPTPRSVGATLAQSVVVQGNLWMSFANQQMYTQYDGYTASPFVLGDRLGIFAETNYQREAVETYPFDQSKPSKLLHYLVSERFLTYFWSWTIDGAPFSNDFYRRVVFEKIRRKPVVDEDSSPRVQQEAHH
jgi:sulfide:quinone oxidoreductase